LVYHFTWVFFYARVYRLIRVGWRDFALFWMNFVCYYRVRWPRCSCLQYCVRGRVWPLGFRRDSSFYFHFSFVFLS
jgi:hypothetical protein